MVGNPHQRHGQAGTLTDFADRFGAIYDIRFEIYQRKFFVKFLNNFINQLTPFFFYSIGGYLVISGSLVVRRAGGGAGGLQGHGLAVEGTARLLPAEGGFADQVRADHRAVPAGGADRYPLHCSPSRRRSRGVRRAAASAISSLAEDDRNRVARRGQLQLRARRACRDRRPGAAAARASSAMLLARLVRPTGGRIAIGGHDMAELPVAVIGRRIGYVGRPAVPVRRHAARQSVLGLRHRPLRPAEVRRGAVRAGAARQLRRRGAPATSISTCTPTGSITPRPACADAAIVGAHRWKCWPGSISRRTSTISACAGAIEPPAASRS